MCKRAYALAAWAVVSIAAAGEASGSRYWLIREASGRWEYRQGDEAPRPLTGQYEPVFPAGEVRCLEADLARCELRYLVNARTSATERLPVKLAQSRQWVSLRTLQAPPPPVLPATSSELASKFTRVARPGGSRAASGCGGDIPLSAPTCGENVDIEHFAVRWHGIDRGKLTILVEKADGAPALFRSSVAASAGTFADESLHAFLRKLQSEADPVDVSLRVLAEGGRWSVRLVRIPPSAQNDAYSRRARAIANLPGVAVMATRMSMALEQGMWSRAAELATELAAGARSNADPALEYALVGLCRSDFDEQKALLRRRLQAGRFNELCGTPPPPTEDANDSTGPAPPPSLAPAAGMESGHQRLGIALLIGNSDYWNLPLNSVKSDLQGMSAVLRSTGFSVVAKENLRTPRHFVEALEEVLRKESATPEDVLVVYYSGHGLQLDGKSHLLSTGVSASARVAEDLRDNAQSTEDLLSEMERAIPGTRILIVDACRDNVLSSGSGQRPADRGGFAFQQDDVANTFVMFANKPGLTAPVRSDYGLMGPFTEALVYALQSSTGSIAEVFEIASKKTQEISPGQEPVMYHSKVVDRVVLRRADASLRDARAKDLLNGAEPLYRAHAWDEFVATMTRARALASESVLQERLSREAEFGRLVLDAERAQASADWGTAASMWQKAAPLFPSREWVSMNAAVAWLMADDLVQATRALAALSRSESDVGTQAKRMLGDLSRSFDSLQDEARRAAEAAPVRLATDEFEKLREEQ